MRILPPVEEKYVAPYATPELKDPLISIVPLQETLEWQFNRTLTREYLAKPSNKVARQTFIGSDHTKIEQRMNFTCENYR